MSVWDFDKYCGWVDDQKAVQQVMAEQDYPLFGPACAATGTPGSGRGKRKVLAGALAACCGGVYPTKHQGTKDCTSNGAGGAVDNLKALSVARGLITWNGETATEVIHGFARHEIMKDYFGPSPGGTSGASAGNACKKYGTLLRQKYLGGKYDFSTYNAGLADRFGDTGNRGGGIPDELEPMARENVVTGISLVTTWAELCDAIDAEYPVTIASNCGFIVRGRCARDKDGFLAPGGSWSHQMLIIGYDDTGRRPGALIVNSWGDDKSGWISGPRLEEMPGGSFWADAEVVESRILRAQDSFAYSDFKGGGFPPRYKTAGDVLRPHKPSPILVP